MTEEEQLLRSSELPVLAGLARYCSASAQLSRLLGVSAAHVPPAHACPFPPVYGSAVPGRVRLALSCRGGVIAARMARTFRGREVNVYCQRALLLGVCIARRVAAVQVHSARDKLFRQGIALRLSGNFAAAALHFELACKLGHARAHAELSWMTAFGRDGVGRSRQRSHDLAATGVRFGCDHSKGALSYCLLYGQDCPQDADMARELARESCAAGCSYGQFMLAKMHRNGSAGLKHNHIQAAALSRAAADQGLAEAQYCLGLMHQQGLMHEPGFPAAARYEAALQLYRAAAAQGQPSAMHAIGTMYECGRGTEASTEEAIRWFMRAHAAGDSSALDALQRHRKYLPAFGLAL